MRNMLKADFKKAFSAKFIYLLLAVAIFIPLITTGMLDLIDRVLVGGEGLITEGLFPVTSLVASGFSPANNIGILVLITLVVLGANEFNHNTIRNKIIAGYPKEKIFLSALIYNLVIMSLITLVYISATYLFNGFFHGFDGAEFLNVLEYSVIGFSSLFFFYTLVTLLMFKFKNIVAPLLISLGSLMFINAFYSIIMALNSPNVDLTFIHHILPIIRVSSPALLLNLDATKLFIDTDLWWVDLLANIGHVTWLTFLGIHIARKTDYK